MLNEDKLTESDLDELVHELKAAEASVINNSGREAQLEYLRLYLRMTSDTHERGDDERLDK